MKIVVGVDESQTSREALERAVTLAGLLEAEIDVVHVSYVPATVLAAMSGVPMASEDFAAAQSQAVWDGLQDVIDGASVTVNTIDLDGYPADCLVEHAATVDADLLVVGSRGRGALASLFLGSTSHRVVNHAPCDVLVVRHQQEG